MPVDLQISPLGDLVFTGGRDLAITQAGTLRRQRMMMRLRMRRGSYKYNRNLGSDLYTLLNQPNIAQARSRASSLVMAALRSMGDISIQDVEVSQDETKPRTVIVKIAANALMERGMLAPINSPFVDEISVPLAPQPSETTARA